MDKRIKILTKNLLDECIKSLDSLSNDYHNGATAAVAVHMSEAYACTKVLHLITAAYEDDSNGTAFDTIGKFIENFRVFNSDFLEDMSNKHSLSHMLGNTDDLIKICQMAKQQL